ncbi:MAG: dihydroorotate dehydrogenase electron transfer subunit [Candidatus Hadarchaeum sp.]|uniref:dihydroorotate dehydrogenase electron transfer subunit n=1 Tax=Candidatus Hadarchaeum sp. TaxID=2883567 RepID=UPI00316D6C6D
MRDKSSIRTQDEVVGKNQFERFGFLPARIKKTVDENSRVKSFYLEYTASRLPCPGQFFMVWLPGFEEVPMSVSDAGEGFIRISISNEGPTTAEFHRLNKGDRLFLRGPFGNGFFLKGRSFLLVGGGYGTAPLIFAAKAISSSGGRCTFLFGARRGEELLFVAEARKMGIRSVVATEDGSEGCMGLVTDLMKSELKKRRYQAILTCGPERMMYEVVRQGVKLGIRVQASLERYMKCGFGVCGSCVLDPLGLRVCSDGPVFDGAILLKTDFGKRKREVSGARVNLC